MKTIHEGWLSYMNRVIPKSADGLQIKETKRAFYAGMMNMFDLLTKDITKFDDEDEAEREIEKIYQNLIEYKDQIGKSE